MTTREEFEKWADKNGYSVHKNKFWLYTMIGTQRAWSAYQAATTRQEAKIKALVEALEGVAAMARCGQLDKFIGEPWLNAVHKAIAATKEKS